MCQAYLCATAFTLFARTKSPLPMGGEEKGKEERREYGVLSPEF